MEPSAKMRRGQSDNDSKTQDGNTDKTSSKKLLSEAKQNGNGLSKNNSDSDTKETKASPKKRSVSPRKNAKAQEKAPTKTKGKDSSKSATAGNKKNKKETEEKRSDKGGKKSKVDVAEDEDSTDMDEDRKNIRETERALRSLSGEWEMHAPVFTYEEDNIWEEKDEEEEEKQGEEKPEVQEAQLKVKEEEEAIESNEMETEEPEQEVAEKMEAEAEADAEVDEAKCEEESPENQESQIEECGEQEEEEEDKPEMEQEENEEKDSQDLAETSEDTPVPEEKKDTNPEKVASASSGDSNFSDNGSDDMEILLKIEQQCATIQSQIEYETPEKTEIQSEAKVEEAGVKDHKIDQVLLEEEDEEEEDDDDDEPEEGQLQIVEEESNDEEAKADSQADSEESHEEMNTDNQSMQETGNMALPVPSSMSNSAIILSVQSMIQTNVSHTSAAVAMAPIHLGTIAPMTAAHLNCAPIMPNNPGMTLTQVTPVSVSMAPVSVTPLTITPMTLPMPVMSPLAPMSAVPLPHIQKDSMPMGTLTHPMVPFQHQHPQHHQHYGSEEKRSLDAEAAEQANLEEAAYSVLAEWSASNEGREEETARALVAMTAGHNNMEPCSPGPMPHTPTKMYSPSDHIKKGRPPLLLSVPNTC